MTVGGAGQGNLATLPSTGRPFRIFGPSLDLASGFTLPPRDGESPWMRFNERSRRRPVLTIRCVSWSACIGVLARPACSPVRVPGEGAPESVLRSSGSPAPGRRRRAAAVRRRHGGRPDPGLRTAEAGDRPGRLRRRRPEDIRRRRGTKRPPLSRFPVPQLGARDVGGGRGRRGAISEFLIGSAG
jgi:hypothetical protein